MSTQKNFLSHDLTVNFIASVCNVLPTIEVGKMQFWIQNPVALQSKLSTSLNLTVMILHPLDINLKGKLQIKVTQKSKSSFDQQTARFVAAVIMNLPKLTADWMNAWIENPNKLQQSLRNALS